MENILGLLGGIVLAVVLAVIIIAFQTRQKRAAWTGYVTKIKRIARHTDSSGNWEHPPKHAMILP